MDLLDLLDDAAAGSMEAVFLPANDRVTLGEIWRRGGRSTRWFDAVPNRTIGFVMDSSAACLAAVFGAFQAGLRVVSLPLPPRGSSIDAYQTLMLRICAAAEVNTVLVDARYVALIPDLGIEVFSFDAALSGDGRGRVEKREAEFVQFTSGSTSDPKGVKLGLDKIAANVVAILDALQPQRGDVAVSWLPLSHDMGFIGMALAALCAGSERYAGGGEVVFIAPEHFVRRPESWLQACSDHGATFTAAPDFGFNLARRRGPARAELDLARLRVCITGAEPVRAGTLRGFAEQFAPHGFDQRSFCPAYGLAEAGLAVTMTRPDELWRTLQVDPVALERGAVVEVADGQELVSAGRPLDGYAVLIAGDDSTVVGNVTVEGPSVLTGYLGHAPIQPPGQFRT